MKTSELFKFLIKEKFEKIVRLTFTEYSKPFSIIVIGMIENQKKIRMSTQKLSLPELGTFELFLNSSLCCEEEHRPSDEVIEDKIDEMAKIIEELLHKNNVNVNIKGTNYLD